MCSFSQESETQAGSKSMPGRGVTLQMLLEEKMLEPGNAAMTIEYLVSILTKCRNNINIFLL